jgi:hemerythrin superfamily protein
MYIGGISRLFMTVATAGSGGRNARPEVGGRVNDPIAMLKRDHREVEELLTKLAESKPGPRRRSNVEKVEKALALHMKLEEELLYPLVARIVGTEEEKEAEIEHMLVRDGLRQLAELVDKPGFGAAVEMLKAGIKHHVKEEEKEIFPELKRGLDRETLSELGDKIAKAKAAAGMPARTPRRTARPAPRKARPRTRSKARA